MQNLINKFDKFEPVVASIRSGTSKCAYIGSGAESRVWRVEIGEDRYVIKLPIKFSPRGRPRDIKRMIEGQARTGLRGLGIVGLEQICAASIDMEATVYGYIDGVSVSEMTVDDARMVTDQQLARLMNRVKLASDRGIMFDGWNDDGSNAIYSADEGITLIDYWSENKRIDVQNNMRYVMKSLGSLGVGLTRRLDGSSNIAINRER